jgi:hypothetical protein
MTEKLDVNKLEAKDGVITIVHRTDAERTVHGRTAVTLNGTIQSPGNFITVRKEQEAFDRSYVEFSYENRYIRLTTKERCETLGHVIEGKLIVNPKIKELGFNAGTKFGAKELMRHLKFNRAYFADKEQNMSVVANLANFNAQATKQIDIQGDDRGNAKNNFEVKVDTNCRLDFNICMPIFIGQPKKTFKVEIMFEVREKHVEFWLESIELAELQVADCEAIINAELERIPEAIVRIQQ